jgi:hypothetical protein
LVVVVGGEGGVLQLVQGVGGSRGPQPEILVERRLNHLRAQQKFSAPRQTGGNSPPSGMRTRH